MILSVYICKSISRHVPGGTKLTVVSMWKSLFLYCYLLIIVFSIKTTTNVLLPHPVCMYMCIYIHIYVYIWYMYIHRHTSFVIGRKDLMCFFSNGWVCTRWFLRFYLGFTALDMLKEKKEESDLIVDGNRLSLLITF